MPRAFGWGTRAQIEEPARGSQSVKTYVMLLLCKDQKGIVARTTQFIYESGGNIIDLDEHADADAGRFTMRLSWTPGESMTVDDARRGFEPIARDLDATCEIHDLGERMRLALFVSKYDHCLQEILWRHQVGDLDAEIPLIVSNHPDLKPLADLHGIPYRVFNVTKENKAEMEAQQLALLREHRIDAVVLARYMQILSPSFVEPYRNRVLNIHHSFLPAFAGARPHHQAHARGVKIIGATSHYVTADLDAGPIIDQDVVRVSHKDSVVDLVRKSRDVERLVLARTVRLHVDRRILVDGGKTVVFE